MRPLDTAEIGLNLIGLVCASASAGHAHPKSTARDYVRGDSLSREAQFVRDVVAGKSTEYLCDTYFDGLLNAQIIAQELAGL